MRILPYSRQRIDNHDIKSVVKVLKSDFLTQGPNVLRFEKIVSKKIGSKFSVAVNSATSALHVACMALNIKKGVVDIPTAPGWGVDIDTKVLTEHAWQKGKGPGYTNKIKWNKIK